MFPKNRLERSGDSASSRRTRTTRKKQLAQQIGTELRAFSGRLCGRQDAHTVRMVAYAVIEAPFAAIRRHVAAKESPPPYVDLLIRATYEAAVDLLLKRG